MQNLAQPIASEFDSSFAYLTSGSSHTYGGSRRKNKKYTGPSVSARQREGGSLPSNVNAHSLASLANLDLLFDKKVCNIYIYISYSIYILKNILIITVDIYLYIFSSLILFEIITYINNITIFFFKEGFL